MSSLYPPSTPIRKGFYPVETRKATQAYLDLRDQKLLKDVTGEEFLKKYLVGAALAPQTWPPNEGTHVSQIRAGVEKEEFLYTGDAPLLRLLNSISKRIFQATNVNITTEKDVLIFYSAHNREVRNFFKEQHREPDIIALWERSQEFPDIDYSQSDSTPITWCAIAASGEVKISKRDNGKYQLANYLQNHLQLHPELNAVLGLTANLEGYALFYHDASVIHRSAFPWEQHAPLYAFVEKLYTRPFQDTSMQIVGAQSQNPAWVTKFGDNMYISEAPHAMAGPGQRRYTARALNVSNSEVVFLKDIWRDDGRLFFEALLLEQAHKDQRLPGLMYADAHGYVLDEAERRIRTIGNQFGSDGVETDGRYKMRLLTKDIGRALDTVQSLRQFLSVMYDACAVQRNLYRKCRILHRDISDGNIMVAPETEEYRTSCARGFAEVKFVNQVLARDKSCEPAPTCLVIDLGNGANLKAARDKLRERTGTPRFIARSVSSGVLLDAEDFDSQSVTMPPIEELGDYGEFMHSTEYQINNPDLDTESGKNFAHRLFHDAESTFWVIAWTLARSARQGSQEETNPDPDFCQFFHTILRHFPLPRYDSRSNLCRKSIKYWESILHPDLAALSGMLAKMFSYIRPEWAYRPELHPEHVHEALMRLLLAEIARIEDSGEDVLLAIGGRARPPLPPDMAHTGGLNSLSIQVSISLSRPPISLENQRDQPAGAKPNKSGPSVNPGDSGLAKTQTPDLSQQMQQLALQSSTAARQDSEEPMPRDKLKARGQSLVWPPGAGRLLAPEPRVPESPAPEQYVPNEDS